MWRDSPLDAASYAPLPMIKDAAEKGTWRSNCDAVLRTVRDELYQLEREDESIELRMAEQAEQQRAAFEALTHAVDSLIEAETALNRAVLVGDGSVDEPVQMEENVHGDRFFDQYPRRQLVRLPLSPHIYGVLQSERVRRKQLQAVRGAFADYDRAGLIPANLVGHSGGPLPSRFQRLAILRSERGSFRGRERSWFPLSAAAQQQQLDDVRHLVASGSVDDTHLNAVSTCGVEMILCPSDGMLPPTFVSKRLVSVADFERLVAMIRGRDRLPLNADLFASHQRLVDLGLIPASVPLRKDEEYEAMLRREKREHEWKSSGIAPPEFDPDTPLLVPLWVAEQFCEELGCRLPTSAIQRHYTQGLEKHACLFGTVAAIVPEPVAFRDPDPSFLPPVINTAHHDALAEQMQLWRDLTATDCLQSLNMEGRLSDNDNADAHCCTPFGLDSYPATPEWVSDAFGTAARVSEAFEGFRITWSHRDERKGGAWRHFIPTELSLPALRERTWTTGDLESVFGAVWARVEGEGGAGGQSTYIFSNGVRLKIDDGNLRLANITVENFSAARPHLPPAPANATWKFHC